MTDETPPPIEAPPAPVPEPVDPRRAFASAYVHRSFRLAEACSDVAIEPAAALELLKDPETVAHVNRLIATGEYAGDVMDAREMMEITTSVARMSVSDFIAIVKGTGTLENGMPAIGPQSVPAFLATKLRAVALLSAMKYGKYGDMKGLMKALAKRREKRGQSLDRASIHREVSSIFAINVKENPPA